MKVLFPHATDLRSTSVAANPETTWSAATTYNLNDLVQVSSTNKVYKALRGNNLNRNPPDFTEVYSVSSISTTSVAIGTGSKTLTVEAGKDFSVGMIVTIARTATPESRKMTGEITAYTSGTGSMTVEVSSVSGSGTYAEWSVVSEDEVAFWEEVESTNQHKMFDEYANTQTVDTKDIVVKLNTARVDYIAMFGLVGQSVTLELRDATDTTLLWSTSVDLTYGSALVAQISDWYEYFFGEYTFKEDATSDIGVITYDGVLTVTIEARVDAGAACGNLITGRVYDLGDTQFGASAGLKDFSYRDTDDSGRTIVTEGYWAKRNQVNLYIPNYLVDAVYRRLVSLRGTPTAWIGNNTDTSYEALIVYGLYTDFSVTVEGPSHSYCDLTIEGLI